MKSSQNIFDAPEQPGVIVDYKSTTDLKNYCNEKLFIQDSDLLQLGNKSSFHNPKIGHNFLPLFIQYGNYNTTQ